MPALTTKRFCVLLLAIEIAFTAFSIERAARWDAFLIGDCPYYAATVQSLVQDGDWDLRNQLDGDLAGHNTFFALGSDQRIVPKHSVLMPILSIPFYVVMGKAGLLVFNLVQVFALVFGVATLAGGGSAGRLLALAAYLSSPLMAYTYNYAPDILATALLVWCYICARDRRPILAGLLAGLGIWAKIYLAILLLPVAWILLGQGWKSLVICGTVAFIVLLPMLAIQAHLFGSPLTTGYDREARLTPDGFTVAGHYSRFNQPLITGLGNLLFDPEIGLLRTAPLWLLWPVGVWVAWRTRLDSRRTIAALTTALLLNLLVFARYDEWNASFFGNRFLFPALALGFALQGPLWQRAVERITAPKRQ